MQSRITQFFKRFPARSAAGSIFIFIVAEGLFSFCSRTCPPFEDATFDAWFPYTKNQNISFTSSLLHKDTFRIADVYRSEKQTSGFLGPVCKVGARISTPYDTAGKMKLIVTFQKDKSTGNQLNLQVYDLNVYSATFDGQNITVPLPFTSRFLPMATINGKPFSNTIAIERDTVGNKASGVYKIWLAQGTGVVGYERYPTLEQWSKD